MHKVPDSADIGLRTSEIVADFLRGSQFLGRRPDFVRQMTAFAALIAEWGPKANLTAAPQDAGELSFHIIDSLMTARLADEGNSRLSEALADSSHVLDLGSGAGFPGLVLAAALPRVHFSLSESRRKRSSFLRVAAGQMGLANVEIGVRRIELADAMPIYDVITAMAFAQAAVVHEVASAWLKTGGTEILFANPAQDVAPAPAEALGLGDLHRFEYSIPRGKGRMSRVLAVWRRR